MTSKMDPVDAGDHVADDNSDSESDGPVSSVGSECGQPWPCGPERLALVSDYRDNRVSLFLYLAGLLREAIEDLHQLNPSITGDVPDLFDRFLGWPIRPQA